MDICRRIIGLLPNLLKLKNAQYARSSTRFPKMERHKMVAWPVELGAGQQRHYTVLVPRLHSAFRAFACPTLRRITRFVPISLCTHIEPDRHNHQVTGSEPVSVTSLLGDRES
jgi:hypothetical protein